MPLFASYELTSSDHNSPPEKVASNYYAYNEYNKCVVELMLSITTGICADTEQKTTVTKETPSPSKLMTCDIELLRSDIKETSSSREIMASDIGLMASDNVRNCCCIHQTTSCRSKTPSGFEKEISRSKLITNYITIKTADNRKRLTDRGKLRIKN